MTAPVRPPTAERLTTMQLRRLNQTLRPLGKKTCGVCQKTLPLDELHFYRRGDRDGYQSECIRCAVARRVVNQRRRYQTDPAHAERVRARNRRGWWEYHDRALATKRQYKALRFLRILERKVS